MNPRVTFRAILGWCPGFESASRFLPDKEVSNRRIALSIAVLILAAMSTYAVTEALLVAVGFPSKVNLETQYNNPVIHVKDGRTYLVVRQDSTSRIEYSLGKPPVRNLSLYFSELLPDGALRDTVTIAELNDLGGGIHDFLYSKMGKWVLVYSLWGIDSESQSLKSVTSSDGKTWGTPTEVYVGEIDGPQPILLERGDDTLFLDFAVFNRTANLNSWSWQYSIKGDKAWSTAMRAPYSTNSGVPGEFLSESAFIDGDGGVGVVWDEGDKYSRDLGIKYSKLVNGSWSEPKPLKSDSVQLFGQEPRILYSSNHEGYFLFVKDAVQTGQLGWHPVVQVFFSSDWTQWEPRGYFKAWDYSITELTNGELGLVYSWRAEDDAPYNLYYARSVDGSSWSSPQLIEFTRSAEILSMASRSQRTSASYVITLLVSIAILVSLTRWPFRWLS